MNAWTNEEVLHFIKLYQQEPAIWNPQDPDYKDKLKVANAWSRLSQLLSKPVKDLKAKKEVLMVTFRKLLKRKQDSLLAGNKAMYEPAWFAYHAMESFLLPMYCLKNNSVTEMASYLEEGMEVIIEEIPAEVDGEAMTNGFKEKSIISQLKQTPVISQSKQTPIISQSKQTPVISQLKQTPVIAQLKQTPSKNRNSRLHPSTVPASGQDTIERQILKTLNTLSNDLHKKREDECDAYGKLLAFKLRDLPSEQRWRTMYEIDGMFISLLEESQNSPEI